MKQIYRYCLATLLIAVLCTLNTRAQTNEFGYTKLPSTSSAEPAPVGSPAIDFSISPAGGSTFNIPIEVPQGLSGMEPNISITYNSQTGNGIVGWGCNLSGVSVITRTAGDIFHDGMASGITHADDDRFLLDGQRLIEVERIQGSDSVTYILETDPYTRVVLHGLNGTYQNSCWFQVTDKNGNIFEYGHLAGQQTYNDNQKVNAWYISRAENVLGNYMTYQYTKDRYTMYLYSIVYGSNSTAYNALDNRVLFEYESRSDFTEYRIENVSCVMEKRLKRITSQTGNDIYRRYSLSYDTSSDGIGIPFSRLTTVTVSNGDGEELKPVTVQWNNLPAHTVSVKTPDINTVLIQGSSPYSEKSYATGDVNGDGLTDVIEKGYVRYDEPIYQPYEYQYLVPHYAVKDASGNVTFQQGLFFSIDSNLAIDEDWVDIYHSPSTLDIDGDGKAEMVIPRYFNLFGAKQIGFYVFTGDGVSTGVRYVLDATDYKYNVGDFNNDGKGEIVVIESFLSGNSYQGGILGFNTVDSVYRKDFLFDVPSFPKDWLVADMNNDGMADVVAFYDGGYTVFWNDGNWMNSPTTVHPSKTSYTLSLPGTIGMVRQGDFNGDGTTDFIIGLVGSGAWYMETGLGNGECTQSLACTIDGDQTSMSYDSHHIDCMVYDMDGDGKTDAVITQNKYDIFSQFIQSRTSWLRSTGNALVTIRTATSARESDGSPQYYMLGDFNGDGLYELANNGFNCYSSTNADVDPQFRIYAHGGYTPASGKVSSLTDGYGNTTSITYKSLTDAGIYIKGDAGTYPFITCTIPLTVVSSVSSSDGSAGTQLLSYQYEGLKVQLQGRGLVGFTANTVTNQTLGTTAESRVTNWNLNNYSKSETTETQSAGIYTATSHKRFVYYSPAGQSLCPYLAVSQDVDYDGNACHRYYDYDFGLNGVLISEGCDRYDGRSDLSVNDDYVFRKGRYLPQTVIWSPMYIDRNDEFLSETDFAYDAMGRVTLKTEHAGTSHELSTAYTYDNYGNVLTETITGNGIATIHKSYEYDATHRFVTGITEQGIHTTFTYDKWGNRLTETLLAQTSTPQTTAYNYDGWNKLTMTFYPDSTKTVLSDGWGTTAAKRYYLLEQGTAVPWVKTWYDARGRKVYTESVGPKDLDMYSSVSYDTKGQIARTIYNLGSILKIKDYTYDSRGRVLTDVSNSGRTCSYTYGQNSVTCQENGNTYVRTYNADGQVLTATDPDGSVTYVYAAHGNPLSATSGGQTVTMEYDDVANRTKLIDPDAGTQTYSYDALGRIVSQTDARGNTTTYVYNALGQKVSETVGATTTTYTYHTSGGGTGQLATATRGNYILSYGYDSYGRVSSESRNFSGTSYDYTYQYNQQGLLSSKTYPGSVIEQFTYDPYGNMATQTVNGQTVWQHTSSTGTNNQFSLGGGSLTRSLTCNSFGQQTMSLTKKNSDNSSLYLMFFGYDTAKGDLTQRRFGFTNLEQFTYDSSDRLTAATKSGVTASFTYSANGNITSKTGIGQYYYDASQPHAVSAVDNTDGLISENTATCSFNSEGRISAVHDSQANKHIVYTYGPDGNRWYAWKYSPSLLINYIGDVEIISRTGSKTWFYYLANDVLYVKKTGVADSIYYLCRDNIGSIMKITDADGRIAFNATYDPWGHQTVSRNDLGFFRGYTGHEMLPELGLINMNGRMYDPLLGRFLSPDNYVQMPYSSQGFNRYTYCLNNPLKYNDPSGEIPALVVGAILGGIMNVAMNAGEINNAGQFFKYFAVGAGAGIASMYAGSFAAGLVGVSGGIIGGAAYGFGVGLTGGFITGAGNTWIQGGSWADIARGAFVGGVAGGAIGALSGAAFGWWNAHNLGLDPWTGELKMVDIPVEPLEPITINAPESNITIADSKVARFSREVTPYEKGQIGVNRTIESLKAEGYNVYQTEVSIKIDGVINRIDVVASKNEIPYLVEVKNGLKAGFTTNQRINYPKMMLDHPPFKPFGKNSLKVPLFRDLVPENKAYEGPYILLIRRYF